MSASPSSVNSAKAAGSDIASASSQPTSFSSCSSGVSPRRVRTAAASSPNVDSVVGSEQETEVELDEERERDEVPERDGAGDLVVVTLDI